MHFPNAGPRRGLSILNSWQGMGWYTLPPGEPIHQLLLDKASPKNGIRGVPTPSLAIGGIRTLAPKLGLRAGQDGPDQPWPLIGRGLLAMASSRKGLAS